MPVKQKPEDEALDISEIKDYIRDGKQEITITALAQLHKQLSKLFSGWQEKKYYDEELAGVIKEQMGVIAAAFSAIKPEINVSPTIAVDLKPLQSIAGDIARQNTALLSLLKSSQSDEVQRLMTAMIGKSNALLDKQMQFLDRQVIDYSEQFKNMIEAVNKNIPWIIEVTKRDEVRGYLKEATIKPNE